MNYLFDNFGISIIYAIITTLSTVLFLFVPITSTLEQTKLNDVVQIADFKKVHNFEGTIEDKDIYFEIEGGIVKGGEEFNWQNYIKFYDDNTFSPSGLNINSSYCMAYNDSIFEDLTPYVAPSNYTFYKNEIESLLDTNSSDTNSMMPVEIQFLLAVNDIQKISTGQFYVTSQDTEKVVILESEIPNADCYIVNFNGEIIYYTKTNRFGRIYIEITPKVLESLDSLTIRINDNSSIKSGPLLINEDDYIEENELKIIYSSQIELN